MHACSFTQKSKSSEVYFSSDNDSFLKIKKELGDSQGEDYLGYYGIKCESDNFQSKIQTEMHCLINKGQIAPEIYVR